MPLSLFIYPFAYIHTLFPYGLMTILWQVMNREYNVYWTPFDQKKLQCIDELHQRIHELHNNLHTRTMFGKDSLIETKQVLRGTHYISVTPISVASSLLAYIVTIAQLL
jgi:hypothetical protein